MNEKKNLTTEETFASAIQNHKKNKFEIAENLYKEILKKNISDNIWKWQEFSFKENMLKTMNDLTLALLDIKNDKLNFFTFEKN